MLTDTAVELIKERTGEQATNKSALQRLHNGQTQKFNQLKKVLTCHYHHLLYLLLQLLLLLYCLHRSTVIVVAAVVVTVVAVVSAQQYQLQAVIQQWQQQQQNCFQSLRSVSVPRTVLCAHIHDCSVVTRQYDHHSSIAQAFHNH
jgi:TRAP-type uncharacterized transport system fused permease subunit